LRRFFCPRDGWLRQPPAARATFASALLVSVAPFLYVTSVTSVSSVA